MKIIYKILYFFTRLWQATRFLRLGLGLPSCRFYPSCSDYFLQVLEKHGLVCGSYFFLKRITRCHPYGS